MRADFVNEVARILNIERKDLIEKDLILHQILTDLSKDEFFAPNFLFKGGILPHKIILRLSEILRGHRLHVERPERVQQEVSEENTGLPVQCY